MNDIKDARDTKITNMIAATDPLLKAIAAGYSALLLTGNLHDYTIYGGKIYYRPQFIADLLEQNSYTVIRYSKSQGGRIHHYSGLPPDEKKSVDSLLNSVGLLSLLRREGQNNPEEMRTFFRACFRLMQIPHTKDTKPIALIFDYTEHLAPAVQTSAAAADEHTFVAETLHALASSPALKKSRNVLICLARDGLYNSLLNDLFHIDYPFPDEHETNEFIQIVLKRKSEKNTPIQLEKNFTENEFARITRGLRLRDIESMADDAGASKEPLLRQTVLASKADAILKISEGTLSVMTTQLTLDDIVGLEVNKRFFSIVAEKLKQGDPSSPRSILMVGPPGTSKSTFAPILAQMCGFNIVEFQNIKNMYVGESERRLNLALNLVQNLAPAILFIDEITEMIPNRHHSVTNDEISKDLLGQLFKFSAQEELRGKVLLLGASNVPEQLDPAWFDRFILIPFLELLPNEMGQLFNIFQRRMTGKTTIDPQDPNIVKASQLLHQKGISPRKILDIINHALLFSRNGSLTSENILRAAGDYVGPANPFAIAYTSLTAISLTSFASFLPWSFDPENYTFPWYLEGIVDKKTGHIHRDELEKRIQEYRHRTNL